MDPAQLPGLLSLRAGVVGVGVKAWIGGALATHHAAGTTECRSVARGGPITSTPITVACCLLALLAAPSEAGATTRIPVAAAPPALVASVVRITDGDTIKVMAKGKRLRIRLACIDAPETGQTPYGAASRKALLLRLPVNSKVDLMTDGTDRYGRTIATVSRRGVNLNLAMVKLGQAFVYRKYLARCDAPAYLAAERSASAARLGIWNVAGGIERPWDWRQRRHGHQRSRS